MTIINKFRDTTIGVGDNVKITLEIEEGDKKRSQVFEGYIIKIKGKAENRSITVRRIGAQQIGIERIFPLNLPTIKDISVVRPGTKGIRRAKLYYLRKKPKKELEKIYSKTQLRIKSKEQGESKAPKNASTKDQKKS